MRLFRALYPPSRLRKGLGVGARYRTRASDTRPSAEFVQVLAQWGNVRAAAQQVGVSRAHLYRMRRASAQFRQLWDAALVLARPQVEGVLADRALNGVQEVVYYHGEEVATRTRYDSRLLLAHLARLDRIAGTAGVHATVRDFDREVERLLDPPELYDWDDEDEAEGWEDAGWQDEDDAVPDDEEEGAGAEDDTEADADEHGSPDEPEAAAEAVSTAGSEAGSGAAGFPSLDSVSCVSNRPSGEGVGADAGRGAGGDGGQGRDGPSCRVLHH